jgi:hypothetical protein
MTTRRDVFRILAVTSAALPTLPSAQENKEVEGQPGHLHTGPAIQVPVPSKPTFFQPSEFQTIEALAEQGDRRRRSGECGQGQPGALAADFHCHDGSIDDGTTVFKEGVVFSC